MTFDYDDYISIPGPAGSLPRLSLEEKQQLFSSINSKVVEMAASATLDGDFESIAWMNASSSVSVSHTLMASCQLRRIPSILVMIVSIKIVNDQTNVLLKDESGSMNATLDPQVLKLKLQIGSVLQLGIFINLNLENVGLFKPFKDICFINITMDCIKSVFENNGEKRVFSFTSNFIY